MVFCPEKTLTSVIAHIHYFPLDNWRGRAHTYDVMSHLNELFPYTALTLGLISHKKSLITIFCHKHKIKNFIKKFGIFHLKKFQQPSILVYIWNKIAIKLINEF